MSEQVVAEHLGGYVAGGDPATFFPDLWQWLVDGGVSSMIDVGCGEGHALSYFRAGGCTVWGVEGIEQSDPDIVQHDYTSGAWTPQTEVDLVWSCEFVEHVEEAYVPNFLRTFRCAPLVLITHAEPGQAGHHHVNCRPVDYWIGVFAAVGYELDFDMTETTRALSRFNPSPWNHYARSGLAFRRRDADQGHF